MGMEFKMSQEYFEEFDPEKFAAMIKAQAEAEATETTEATEVAEEDGVDKQ